MVNSRETGQVTVTCIFLRDEGKTWGEGSTVHAGNSEMFLSMTLYPREEDWFALRKTITGKLYLPGLTHNFQKLQE